MIQSAAQISQQTLIPGNVQATDHASDATVVELEVKPGDVIVAGTDGLWDNLPIDEVLALLPQDADQAEQVPPGSSLFWCCLFL